MLNHLNKLLLFRAFFVFETESFVLKIGEIVYLCIIKYVAKICNREIDLYGLASNKWNIVSTSIIFSFFFSSTFLLTFGGMVKLSKFQINTNVCYKTKNFSIW